jgi:multidrug efflux system outer membrane protein
MSAGVSAGVIRRSAAVLGALGLVLLAGCTVGPDYAPPPAAPPEDWATPLAGGEDDAAADLTRWWAALNDPMLDSLVERARAGSLDLRLAEARVREARALRGVAAADQFPTVDARGEYTGARTSENVGGSSFGPAGSETDLYSVGFDASWEIDIFGGVRRGVEAADADVQALEEGRRDVLVTLLAEVARNYVEARSFQQRLDVARANVAAQQTAVDLTGARFQAGLVSELDVMQATSNLASTRSQIPTLETGRRQAVHRLGVLIGQAPGALLAELEAPAPVPQGSGRVPVGLPSDLLRRRPDIRRAERELAAQTARIGVATADLFPKFALTGSIGLDAEEAASLFESGSLAWAWGPRVQWRVFDAGRIRANIRAQEARRDQNLAAYDSTVLGALEEVENALVAYGQEQERQAALGEGAAAAERSVVLAADLYRQGLSDFQNVLDAQRTLYELQDGLAASEASVTTNLIALYKALGGGWEEGERLASDLEGSEEPPGG